MRHLIVLLIPFLIGPIASRRRGFAREAESLPALGVGGV